MINIYNELEKYIKEYIKNAEITSVDDFKFIKTINDIIFYEGLRKYDLRYTSKKSLKKNDKFVLEFLEKLNFFYRDYYKMRKIDGTFIYDISKKSENAYSDYDCDNKKRIIYIPLKNTIHDAFAIVHELFHDINLDTCENSVTRYAFTEALSLLAELLLEDYLNEKGIKDYQVNNNRNINSIWYKALEVDFNLQLITNYLDKGYFNEQVFDEILKLYTKPEIEYLELVINDMLEKESLTIDYEQCYIIGIFIATYMYDRIKSNKKNIQEVFELNEMIKEYTIEQVFDYLNLDYDDEELTYDSYQKLKRAYQNYLKSR